jgi:hypothetical protein
MKSLANVRKWGSQPGHKFVVTYRQGGKRQVRYFKREKDAKAFAAEKQIELLNDGRRNGEVTSEEHRAMLVAREKGFSLKEAVDHYAAHLESLHHSASIETVIEEFLSIQQGEGKSPVHLKDLRLRLKAFSVTHVERTVASITTREIDAWLSGLAVAPQTRVNYRRVVHNLFAFAVARGYATGNPVSKASKPKVTPGEIGVLSVEQTRALLQACDPAIIAPVAIGAFAGLRRAEIERLDWRQIDLGRGFIEVSAAKSKTAQRRLVTIEENLRAWLSPLVRESGRVCPPRRGNCSNGIRTRSPTGVSARFRCGPFHAMLRARFSTPSRVEMTRSPPRSFWRLAPPT